MTETYLCLGPCISVTILLLISCWYVNINIYFNRSFSHFDMRYNNKIGNCCWVLNARDGVALTSYQISVVLRFCKRSLRQYTESEIRIISVHRNYLTSKIKATTKTGEGTVQTL